MIEFENTENESAEYAAFIDKFKPKKTTDDCYTPPNVYEAVKTWAVSEYGLQGRQILRPFYPGGDFEAEEYPPGCVVLDNPPFSILSRICAWYDARGVDYFLFAPAITLFSTNSGRSNYIIADCDVTYENGAVVRTSYVTNLGKFKIHVSPELRDLVKLQNDQNARPAVQLPKYVYPDDIVTAATIQKICHHGVGLKIRPEDCAFTRALDAQREQKKSIYGCGFLLSEKAAAEKAAAEKAAAEKAAAEKAAATKWALSNRERMLQKELGKK